MFMVTNRTLKNGKGGIDQLGDTPNPKGPNELRIVEAKKGSGGWQIEVLPDMLDKERKREVGLPVSKPAFASQYASRKILSRVRNDKKNVLFFVHGFNNDVEAVLERADGFASNYSVEVIPFSWPANGGGGVGGVASYKSDKRDARASVVALDRALDKIYTYLHEFNQGLIEQVVDAAKQKFPNNPERRDQFITEQLEKGCPFTVSMLLHSMGNYLYKQVLSSSVFRGTRLLFDNVVMAAADVNNEGHKTWVDKIQCRNRLYIAINENDAALMASRAKSGEEQLARLGHYPYNLNAERAVYVDFTEAAYVGRSHSYFEGVPLKNTVVKNFFNDAVNGKRAEIPLRFDAAKGTHVF